MMSLRILDAAANRAREGLRVVEDYVRFVLDDRFLTSELKTLRHDLTAALTGLPEEGRLAMRDVAGDIGTTITTEAERTRLDEAAVARANWKRLQEALRTLEEFAKPLSITIAAACEALRYRSYTLEKAAFGTVRSRERLAERWLYVLIDGRADEMEFVRAVEEILQAEVDVIQLRDKRLDDRTLFAPRKIAA
ncbi:MAG: hypothetical protein QM811_29900 [Pirellulales bacterium]